MGMMPFEQVIGPLSAALGLSVGVERVLEVFKNVLEPWIGVQFTRQVPTLEESDRSRIALESTLRAATSTAESEWGERVPEHVALVQPATDPDDGTVLRAFILQLLGFALGILFARLFNVQLFEALGAKLAWGPPFDFVLTGLLIGGGSGPVHILLRFVTDRKVASGEAEGEARPAIVVLPVNAAVAPTLLSPRVDPTAEDWPDFEYDGGVDREILQDVHLPPAPPDLAVIHHTAMPRASTFEDVVRVIKSRTDERGNHFLTGYHCVVLVDGSIHPFCRWDRFGNHVAGFNKRSLGLAYNCNCETDPSVPFSNPTGRYGPPRPTEVQLKSGAKVVVLWSYLYPDITIDFQRHIVTHRQLTPDKACPGSQFPWDEFKALVEHYRSRWDKSQLIQERIAAFRMKPYLYYAPPESRPVKQTG
jgi:hypothetical protein